jgi:hypothetical protein
MVLRVVRFRPSVSKIINVKINIRYEPFDLINCLCTLALIKYRPITVGLEEIELPRRYSIHNIMSNGFSGRFGE